MSKKAEHFQNFMDDYRKGGSLKEHILNGFIEGVKFSEVEIKTLKDALVWALSTCENCESLADDDEEAEDVARQIREYREELLPEFYPKEVK